MSCVGRIENSCWGNTDPSVNWHILTHIYLTVYMKSSVFFWGKEIGLVTAWTRVYFKQKQDRIKHRTLCSCPDLQQPGMILAAVRTTEACPTTAAGLKAHRFISQRMLPSPHGAVDLESTAVPAHYTFPWVSSIPIVHWPSAVASLPELVSNHWLRAIKSLLGCRTDWSEDG